MIGRPWFNLFWILSVCSEQTYGISHIHAALADLPLTQQEVVSSVVLFYILLIKISMAVKVKPCNKNSKARGSFIGFSHGRRGNILEFFLLSFIVFSLSLWMHVFWTVWSWSLTSLKYNYVTSLFAFLFHLCHWRHLFKKK